LKDAAVDVVVDVQRELHRGFASKQWRLSA
jgi:hypothetical protein